MSAVDPLLSIVAVCLLLIRFCSLLRMDNQHSVKKAM
jgi:hypothetical protein